MDALTGPGSLAEAGGNQRRFARQYIKQVSFKHMGRSSHEQICGISEVSQAAAAGPTCKSLHKPFDF
jgi:hypothetical protein